MGKPARLPSCLDLGPPTNEEGLGASHLSYAFSARRAVTGITILRESIEEATA